MITGGLYSNPPHENYDMWGVHVSMSVQFMPQSQNAGALHEVA